MRKGRVKEQQVWETLNKVPCHRAVGVQSQEWAGTVPTDKIDLQIIFVMRFGETLNCLYPNIYLDDY